MSRIQSAAFITLVAPRNRAFWSVISWPLIVAVRAETMLQSVERLNNWCRFETLFELAKLFFSGAAVLRALDYEIILVKRKHDALDMYGRFSATPNDDEVEHSITKTELHALGSTGFESLLTRRI